MAPPARKETISSRVLADLRGAILRAELVPGQKINLDQLRERFDTSISPLREALARLTADGLVLFEDQRGFRVSRVSAAELDDLFATRMTLEPVALSEAMRHGDMDWESEVIRALHRLSRTSPAVDPLLWLSVHDTFHKALIAGRSRALQRRLCAGLIDLSHRYRALTGLAGDGEGSPDSHEALAEAALRRDTVAATERLCRHIEAERAALARSFASGPHEARVPVKPVEGPRPSGIT
jgi:GntR family carbon starvation induced transcriptional regulator